MPCSAVKSHVLSCRPIDEIMVRKNTLQPLISSNGAIAPRGILGRMELKSTEAHGTPEGGIDRRHVILIYYKITKGKIGGKIRSKDVGDSREEVQGARASGAHVDCCAADGRREVRSRVRRSRRSRFFNCLPASFVTQGRRCGRGRQARQGSLLPAEMQLRTQLSQVRRGEKKIRRVLTGCFSAEHFHIWKIEKTKGKEKKNEDCGLRGEGRGVSAFRSYAGVPCL